MKRFTKSLILFIFLAVWSSAYAHPPSDIKITFDPNTKMLEAVIFHDVSDTVKHYIKKVDVGLNAKAIIEQSISRQDNNNTQTVHYLIPDVNDNDVISIEAYCSISGKLKKEITVHINNP